MKSRKTLPLADIEVPAARKRGDIQEGRAGDKVPGFDPAAAPLETDAEAAGTGQAAPKRWEHDAKFAGVDPRSTNSSSHGPALLRFEADGRPTRHLFALVVFATAFALAVAGIVLATIYSWLI